LPASKRLIIRHEKQFVVTVKQVGYAHWSVQFEPEVVPFERVRPGGGELILLSVKFVVAQKLKSAMIGVAPDLVSTSLGALVPSAGYRFEP
jgi:hypothetical protein